MPDIDPQIVSVALTFFLLINAAKSTITEVFSSRVRGKSLAAKGDKDDSPATSVVEKKTRATARRGSIDPYSIIEGHIVRGVVVVLLSFGVYKLIIAELPHREPQQRMSLAQIESEGNTQQWEYIIRNKTLSEGELEALGDDRWELIDHKFEKELKIDTYIFKRPKS